MSLGDVLLQASSLGPVYTVPIHAMPAPIPANVALIESADLWHRRLGHCGPSVLETLKKKFKSVFSQLCGTCNVAKSHRLPFVSAKHRIVFASKLIHSDV